MLGRWAAHPQHIYWQESRKGLLDPSFQKILPCILTHKIVTDGYLVSVASENGGKLATLDRPLANLFPSFVEIIK